MRNTIRPVRGRPHTPHSRSRRHSSVRPRSTKPSATWPLRCRSVIRGTTSPPRQGAPARCTGTPGTSNGRPVTASRLPGCTRAWNPPDRRAIASPVTQAAPGSGRDKDQGRGDGRGRRGSHARKRDRMYTDEGAVREAHPGEGRFPGRGGPAADAARCPRGCRPLAWTRPACRAAEDQLPYRTLTSPIACGTAGWSRDSPPPDARQRARRTGSARAPRPPARRSRPAPASRRPAAGHDQSSTRTPA